jgi:acetylornithine deacetylase/succinyl-diaminopimelate desuccinylase-like protein
MIPDICLFELDIRLPIGLVAADVMAVIDSIIRQHENATMEIKVQEAASNPPSYSHLSHPMVRLLAKNADSLKAGDRTTAIPSMGATDC